MLRDPMKVAVGDAVSYFVGAVRHDALVTAVHPGQAVPAVDLVYVDPTGVARPGVRLVPHLTTHAGQYHWTTPRDSQPWADLEGWYVWARNLHSAHWPATPEIVVSVGPVQNYKVRLGWETEYMIVREGYPLDDVVFLRVVGRTS